MLDTLDTEKIKYQLYIHCFPNYQVAILNNLLKIPCVSLTKSQM